MIIDEVYYKCYLWFMFIFMLCATPLSFFIIYSIYNVWQGEKKLLIENLGWGIKIFIITLIIFLIFQYFLKTDWTLKGLFLYHMLRDYGLWALFSLIGYFLVFGLSKKSFEEKAGEVLGYFMGFYLLLGLIDTLFLFGEYDPYTLFMLPVFRFSFILLFSFFFALSGNLNFQLQFLIGIGCFLLTFLGSAGGMLFYSRQILMAWGVTGVVLAGAVVSFFIMLKKTK